MTIMRARLASVAVLAVAAAALTGPSASAGDDASTARDATARYHDFSVAQADGFGQLRDSAGIACIDNPGVGAMGIHYVLGSRVGNASELASEPEALIYEPQANGRMRLVAVEYVVLQSTWTEAGNTGRPHLFGQDFELVNAGNRYGLPPFYELHAWIWKHNPAGMNADWNPDVSCANA